MEKNKANVPKIRFPGFTGEWERRKLKEIMDSYEDPVTTPRQGYTRLGIKSHAKGTFHRYVKKGEELETAKMYRVADGKFIVNITFGWEHAVAITNENDDGKLVSHRFPQFQFHDDLNPEFFKYVILDKRFKYHLCISSPGGAGRNRVLNISEMLKYKILSPCEEEQRKIACFFRKIDNLITLHQRKLNHLQAKKKGLLQKMFPEDGEDVPELRFPGFTDAWERRKLGDIASFSKGQGYSKNDLTDTGMPIILYGRLYTKYQSAIDVVDTFTIEKAGSIYSKGNEVIVPASGETAEDISRASAVVRPGVLLGGDLNIVYPEDRINSIFLAISLSNGKQQKELSKRAQGKSVVHLHNSDLQNVELQFPTIKEQIQISSFFKQLDNLILLHQRKLTHLQEQKKALLQQMFI